MTGLLLKEFYALRKYLGQYAIIFIFFACISYYMASPIYLMSMFTMCLGMLTLSGMTYDNLAGWDKYALTMPVSRKTIVLSKYLINIIFDGIAMVAGVAGSILLSKLLPQSDEGILEICLVAAVLFVFVIFVYAIVLPLIFKFGVERTRSLMVIVMIVPIFGILALAKIAPASVFEFITNHAVVMGVGAAVFFILFYIASAYVSIGIYSKKEF